MVSFIQLPNDAIYMPLGHETPIGKPGLGSMLSVVDPGLAPVPWEDLDPAMAQEIQRESSRNTLEVVKEGLWRQDAVKLPSGGEEYVLSDAAASNSPCNVPNPDVFPECGLCELPSTIHSDDKTEHDAFFVQTYIGKVENAEYATPHKPLLSTRGEQPLDEELDPVPLLREYVDSKRRLVAKILCCAKPTRRSWPLKQGSMGDISHLK